MNLLRHYKQIILLICLLGIVATAAMRITDITDFAMGLIDACMPLIVGFCMAFVLNIIVSRLERILWPGKGHPIARHARRPVAILLTTLRTPLAQITHPSLPLNGTHNGIRRYTWNNVHMISHKF